MDKGFEIAINFLLYSYFKITLDSTPDFIIKKSINRAYSDATNQKAFNALHKSEFNSNKLKSDGAGIIEEGIEEIIKQHSDFDMVHDKMCKELVKIYSGVKDEDTKEHAFSYGNAQKWVNMTMKYLYVIGNVFLNAKPDHDFVKYAEKINAIKIHIPVDSYILKAFWEDEDLDKNVLPDGKSEKKDGAYSSDKMKAWSKWDSKEYRNFWKHLSGKKACPIEWEAPEWIRISQKRNKENPENR